MVGGDWRLVVGDGVVGLVRIVGFFHDRLLGVLVTRSRVAVVVDVVPTRVITVVITVVVTLRGGARDPRFLSVRVPVAHVRVERQVSGQPHTVEGQRKGHDERNHCPPTSSAACFR